MASLGTGSERWLGAGPQPLVELWGRGQQQRDEPQPQLYPDGGVHRVADGERGVWQRHAHAYQLHYGQQRLHGHDDRDHLHL